MPRPPKHGIAFTDRSLRALRPHPRRVDYTDLTLRGFGIMVQPSGLKRFFVRYRTPRGFRRLILGTYPATELAKARDAAKAALGKVALGNDPQQDRRESRTAATFADLARDFLELHSKRLKRTWKEDEAMLNRDLLPAWKSLPVTEIRRRDVSEMLDRIVARGAPIHANRVRALVSKMFNFALTRELVEFNPVAGVPAPSPEQTRDRVLSDDEIRQLWAVWSQEGSISADAFKMLLLTGQREMEVLTMAWQAISTSWWTIPPSSTKNKRSHRVYLADPTLVLVDTLRAKTGDRAWVFASPRTSRHIVSLSNAVDRFRDDSGIYDWCPHDLRRTAATHMGRLGVSRVAIGRILNHAERGVTAIYDRSTGEVDVEQGLTVWANQLELILRSKSSDITAPGSTVIQFSASPEAAASAESQASNGRAQISTA